MNEHPIAHRSLLLTGSTLAMAAMPAFAQDGDVEYAEPAEFAEMAAPAPESGELPEGNAIYVTATKREQTLQDVPVAVTVATEEQIERAEVRSVADLAILVPSLRVTQLQSSANTNFLIRGFGNGANNAGIEPSVGVFVDGVYRSRSAARVNDLPDLQRIEVLGGPQSTLFGKNASAGVISIVTAEPKFRFGGQVEASYGNFDARTAKGLVTGPITEDLAASLAGGVNNRDGYIRDLERGERTNERNRWFTRGQLLWQPNALWKVRLIGDYEKLDEDCCATVLLRPGATAQAVAFLGGRASDPEHPFADEVYSNFSSRNELESWGFSGQVDFGYGPFKLTSITSYRGSDALTNQDSDFTSAELISHNYQDLSIRTFTQELRAQATFDSIDMLLGGFFLHEDVDQQNQVYYGDQFRNYADLLIQQQSMGAYSVAGIEMMLNDLTTMPGAFDGVFFRSGQGLTESYDLKGTSFSLFGQVDFHATDRLTLTGGLNYSKDRKRFATNVDSSDVFSSLDFGAVVDPVLAAQLAQLQFLPPFLNVPNVVEDGRISDDDISVTLRAAYEVDRSVNVYASYATGYKAPSVNLSRDSRPFASDAQAIADAMIGVPNLTFGGRFADAEESEMWELGLKGDFGPARVTFAAFHQKIQGFQSNIFTGTGFLLLNAGQQKVTGFEFDGVVQPVDPLQLRVALTYLDSDYGDFPISGIGDLSGTDPAGIPEVSVTFSGQYTHEMANASRVIAFAAFHYESPVMLVEGLPGYLPLGQDAAINVLRPFKRQVDDLSASLTYAMANGFEIAAWGRNLLDDRYFLSAFDTPVQLFSASAYPNQPRTYGMTVRYKF